jgi:hypothetical protein
MSATELVNVLQASDPMVCTWEGLAFKGLVRFYPDALDDGDATAVVDAVRRCLG